MIVIEEFSMLRHPFFELLDEIARRAKGSSLPFGGVRLMLVGDVAQLPPVGDFTVGLGDDGEQDTTRYPSCLRLRNANTASKLKPSSKPHCLSAGTGCNQTRSAISSVLL